MGIGRSIDPFPTPTSVTVDLERPDDLPESVATLLDQQDPETVMAIHAYCEILLAEYDLADEIEDRTYG